MFDGQRGRLGDVGGLAGAIACDDAGARGKALERLFQVLRGPDKAHRPLGGTEQPHDRALLGMGLGGDLDLDRRAFRKAGGSAQRRHRVRPLAQIDKQARQRAVDPPDPADDHRPELLLRRIVEAFDQQPFRPAIQGDDAAALARRKVEIERALHDARQPRPASRQLVS